MNKNKGFTLLELLIVIGILAILATVIIVAINPAELLRRARDSQRISDLSSITSAIAFYLAEASTPVLSGPTSTAGFGTTAKLTNDACEPGIGAASPWTIVYYSLGIPTTGTTTGLGINNALPSNWSTFSTSSQGVGGINGWIPVNLGGLTAGSPIAKFPIDPRNTTTSAEGFFYAYVCQRSPLSFELFANMESDSYRNGQPNDKESTDGGYAPNYYETGSLIFATDTDIFADPTP